ncbi:hypothetical protein [Streptomyces sp. 891-h]|uniref:hypothetical protein n=1 Tax=Streptomyces sp. 891-h TaxID=2720714 RepID=UPI001FAAFEA8|nr:hypothetical protein [Streptomyces sp. 891-h]UNZ22312.1 hypothetical protein HC362_34670 [Streptomyces sp. 891-h]
MWIALFSPRSTGKSVAAWWLLHALHARGYPVLGVDADESKQMYRWWEAQFPADDDQEEGDEFEAPFEVHRMADSRFHEQAADMLPPGHIGVVDVGHLENHSAIGLSVMRVVDLALITCAPTAGDVERMDDLPMDFFIERGIKKRPAGAPEPERWILFTRNQLGATRAVKELRTSLGDDGWNILSTVIPATQTYSSTGEGVEIYAPGSHFDELVTELETKGLLDKRMVTE